MSASPHRQAILIFSVGIPGFLIVGLLVAMLIGRGKLQASHAEKVSKLQSYQAAERQVKELESMLSLDNRREKIEYWNTKLDQDFIQSLSANLGKILARYDDSVLKQTEMTKAQASTGIAGRTDNPHSLIQLSFEGGFKPMQSLLAELEREMPQLVLESLAIKANPSRADGDAGKLSFTVVYLCWEKA